jgi:membrane-associated phospholipid phosphatase
MIDLKAWLISLAAIAGAVAGSYIWIDRPLALFSHSYLRDYWVFDRLTLIPEWFPLIAVLLLVAFGARALTGRSLSTPGRVAALGSISLIAARAIKDQLKFAFGRTWPETWAHDNPSFIRDGIYGFHPFHGGAGFDAFPSGHATAICAVMSVLWLCYPKLRALYALCAVAVSIGLIGANYHFLGDVIAGCFLGASAGVMTVALAESNGRSMSQKMTRSRGSWIASDSES